MAQARERECSERESEVAQRHVEVARNQQQVDDDEQEPCRDDVSENLRLEPDAEARDDLDDAEASISSCP